jgi:hypothetical protein
LHRRLVLRSLSFGCLLSFCCGLLPLGFQLPRGVRFCGLIMFGPLSSLGHTSSSVGFERGTGGRNGPRRLGHSRNITAAAHLLPMPFVYRTDRVAGSLRVSLDHRADG